jgi:hypothetical protein
VNEAQAQQVVGLGSAVIADQHLGQAAVVVAVSSNDRLLDIIRLLLLVSLLAALNGKL